MILKKSIEPNVEKMRESLKKFKIFVKECLESVIIGTTVTKIKKRMEQKTMKKQQETQVLKGIYSEAIKMIIKSVDNRVDAIYNYETYLETVEKTVQVFNADFDLERDLKLVSRGLDEAVLRYVTRLDHEKQREQLNFYRDIKSSL